MSCDYSKETLRVSPKISNFEGKFLPSEIIFCKYCKEFLEFRKENQTKKTSRTVCDSCLGLSCDCGHFGLEHNLAYGSCFFYDPTKKNLCNCKQFKKTNS